MTGNHISGLLFFKKFTVFSLWKSITSFLCTFSLLIATTYFLKIPLVERFPGKIRLQPELSIHSTKVSGVIDEIKVEVGDAVTEGEALLTVRSTSVPNALLLKSLENSKISDIEQQKLSIDALKERRISGELKTENKIDTLRNEIKDITTKMFSMNDQLDLLLSQEQRAIMLYDRKVGTLQDVEKAKLSTENFEQDLLDLKIRLPRIKSEISQQQEELSQSNKEIDIDLSLKQENLKELQRELSQLSAENIWFIHAKRSGIVSAINVKPYEVITPGKNALDIIQPNKNIELDFFQPIAKRTSLKAKSEIKVGIDAFPTEIFGLYPAEIISVSKSPDPETSSYKHTAIFTIPDELPKIEDGHAITANILVDHLTAFEWLVSPYLPKTY